MVLFYNPFTRKEHSNYPGIVVPLAPSSERRLSTLSHTSLVDTDKKPSPDGKSEKSVDRSENGIGPVPTSGPLTLEGLRAEVESDLAASGHDSAYDRMFPYCRP